MWQWMVDLFWDIVDAFVSIFDGIIFFIQNVLTWIVNFFIGLLPPDVVSGAAFGIDWDFLSVITDGLLYIFPVSTCLTLIFLTYVTSATVRSARWVLAFVPTIGG